MSELTTCHPLSELTTCHPCAPNRPYVPWQRKVKAQLECLQSVPNPDIRTREEIRKLKEKLDVCHRNLLLSRKPKMCVNGGCTRMVVGQYKQCLTCRQNKRGFMRRKRAEKS